MFSPDWTERLLARRFGEERASEIVGDLQEQHGPRFLPLRVLSLTASMPWPEWAAGLLFAILLALYQWPLTEYAWEIPRWFTEHHLTDGASGTWYFLFTELSYTACFLTVICVLRDLRATPRVWIGVAYSVALPVLSVLAMRPYLRPFSLAVFFGAGAFWAVRRRASDVSIRFSTVLASSLALDWPVLRLQGRIALTYVLHLLHLHRHPGVHHALMWPIAGIDGVRHLLIAVFAAFALTLTQQQPASRRVVVE